MRTREAFRPGTRANHYSHVVLYVAFSLWFPATDFPAQAIHLQRFGEFLLRSFRAPKSVLNVISSVRQFHLAHGYDTQAFIDYTFGLWKRAVNKTVRHVPAPAQALPKKVLERLCCLAQSLGGQGMVFSAFLSTLFYSLARLSSLAPPDYRSFDSTRWPILDDLR